jgi:hypothetical protein
MPDPIHGLATGPWRPDLLRCQESGASAAYLTRSLHAGYILRVAVDLPGDIERLEFVGVPHLR